MQTYTTMNVQRKNIVALTPKTNLSCDKDIKFMSQQGHDDK